MTEVVIGKPQKQIAIRTHEWHFNSPVSLFRLAKASWDSTCFACELLVKQIVVILVSNYNR